ncbi:MAG: long-chain acyl-CoA synthetase, partial [Mycobacterium sp.]|nr:long-chain acyl-CoA synthetase [Mycobacterium sp.]
MSTVVHRETVTVGEAFLAMVDSRADAPAILNADLEVVLSWRDYGTQARRAATGLAALGLGQGDTLGLLLSNRPEFHVADAGALLLGATPFSMYNTSAPEQLTHLVADADCRIIITEAIKWVSCSGAEVLYIEKGVAPRSSAPASATWNSGRLL